MAEIRGTSGADILDGTADADDIWGLGGADTLSGMGGNDRLTGGQGNDNLTGGTGRDVFVFGVDSGDDIITDFEDTIDRLVFSATGLTFADLAISAAGSDTLILDGLGNSITLTGFNPADISTGDIVFSSLISSVTAIELTDIEAGIGGFVINGVSLLDNSGKSVSGAGDVNGDGLDDLIVGAWLDDPNGAYSGASFVVFGKADGGVVELSDIEAGIGGFVINGVSAGDRSGRSVSGAGDVNGDGLADLIVGAYFDTPNGTSSGASFVVFGKADGGVVELSAIEMDANNGGFVINGVSGGDTSGRSVSGAGDVNGDGLADLIIGTFANPNGFDSGASFVVFGKAGGGVVELSDIEAGIGGFVINGVSAGDRSGRSVSAAGDVNGDGLADLIVGASGDDPNGSFSGASFVVFGKADGTAVELSDIELGIGGFVINGASSGDYSGFSVSAAGDVNGDGLDDLIVGAYFGAPNGTNSGASFVVFGKADGSAVELSAIEAGIGGFVINGVSTGDGSGFSVSSAGDVNGDGLDDLIVGANRDDPNGFLSGASFVVFGKADGTAVELVDIEKGIGGFVINGVSTGDQSGGAVSNAGDVNGDGFDDLIVGASYDDTNGDDSGASFVIFGGDFTGSVDILGSDGADVLVGTDADEIIIGAQGDDSLSGGGGDDRLSGAAGNDVLEGGAGADVLDGGGGVDTASYASSVAGVTVELLLGTASGGDAAGDVLTSIENLIGSAFDDVLTGDGGNNVLSGGDGKDELIGGAGADALDGGTGSDTASYEDSASAVTVNLGTGSASGGDAAGDTFVSIENLIGSSLVDSLTGDSGANVLEGGAGADALDGGAGSDTASYAGSAAAVTVNLNAGTTSGGDAAGDVLISIENLIGSAFDDVLTGDGGNNVLSGGDGDDTFDGGAGTDRLIGGAGADTLDGGSGSDTASYAGSAAGVTVDLNAGTASGGDAAGDVLTSIERLIGSSFDDTLTGTSGNNRIDGGDGNDSLFGLGGNDQLNGLGGNDTMDGGAGNDRLIGNAGADIIFGGDGADQIQGNRDDDVLDGGAGDDIVLGNAGNDTVLGGAGDDNVQGNKGDDLLEGGAGADTLNGGSGIDIASYASSNATVVVRLDLGTATGGDADGDVLSNIEGLRGSAFSDKLVGDAGDNVLEGLAGNDRLTGLAGDDTIDGGAGNDRIIGNAGEDTIFGGAGNDNLQGNRGADHIEGGDGDDLILGNTFNDVLIGGAGNDEIQGNRDNDTLFGNAGMDILSGGSGIDTLDGGADADTLDGGSGNDSLTGGAGSDTFVFSGNWGDDTITDFEDGSDLLDFSGAGLGFGDLTISQSANDTLVEDAFGNSITLEGIAATDITVDDFLF